MVRHALTESLRMRIATIFFITLLLDLSAAFADDGSDPLIGVWKLEPRQLVGENYVDHQEESTFSVSERMPDGRYRVVVTIRHRVVAKEAGLINIPGCEDKTECVYDSATEGVGSSFRSAFYVDYFSESWIDDLFTVKGNVMTGDDGNGPIKLVKQE